MKYLVLLVSLVYCTTGFAQRKPKIKGNKVVVEVKEDLPAFNAIELNDDLNITLEKAGHEGYQLLIDDNLIDVLKFKVEDSTLRISSFYKITSKKKLDITVNYFELSRLVVREGKIKMTDVIKSDQLTIQTFGSAKVDLSAQTGYTKLVMEGNSAGDFNIESDSLDVVLKDRIDTRIYATSQAVKVQMNSNSAVTFEGSAYALTANLFDNANLRARKLQAEGVEVIAEGSPTARVFANLDFELTSRGSSKTYLSGDAKIDVIEFLDTSELHKQK